MHQLGVAKRAIEAFAYLIMGKDDDESAPTFTHKKGSLAAIESIGNLGRLYGGYIIRLQFIRLTVKPLPANPGLSY